MRTATVELLQRLADHRARQLLPLPPQGDGVPCWEAHATMPVELVHSAQLLPQALASCRADAEYHAAAMGLQLDARVHSRQVTLYRPCSDGQHLVPTQPGESAIVAVVQLRWRIVGGVN